MTGHDPGERPPPGSHARETPTGTLEQSSATLFAAAEAARDAEAGGDPGALHAFYRVVAEATLLLPVPPGADD